GVHLLNHDGLRGDLEIVQVGQVGMHPLAQRQQDLLAGAGVVAVHQHAHGSVGHDADATATFVRPGRFWLRGSPRYSNGAMSLGSKYSSMRLIRPLSASLITMPTRNA